MTPMVIAGFMASLFARWSGEIKLLDAGAGLGVTRAFARRFIERASKDATLSVTAYEIDQAFLSQLQTHAQELKSNFKKRGRTFTSTIVDKDFIIDSSFRTPIDTHRFTHAILNPPYRKVSSDSQHAKMMRKVDLRAVNLYTAFLGLAIRRIEPGGEIVAIIPRSFCNGAYHRPFREWLFERVAIRHIHVFESRNQTFKDDGVLQENIIIHLERGGTQHGVTISTSFTALLAIIASVFSPLIKSLRLLTLNSFCTSRPLRIWKAHVFSPTRWMN